MIGYFRYKAVSGQGKRINGTIPAVSRSDALYYLTHRNLHILELKELRYRAWLNPLMLIAALEKIGYRPYKSRDLMIFCRQLASMLQAGVTLLQALRMLAGRFENIAFRKRINAVLGSIEQGSSFSEALYKEYNFFPPILTGMVETGETAGALDTIMDRLAEHYEKDHDLDEKLRAATTYPLFILSVALVVIAIMVLFVLPQFASIFNAFGMEMPLFSRALLLAGQLTAHYWPLLSLIAAALYITLRLAVNKEEGRLYFDRLKLRLPLFGKIYTQTAAARFARCLGTLLASGVTLYSALQLVDKVVNNRALSASIDKLTEALARGETMAEPMRDLQYFPPLLVEMIKVGEESGTLEDTLTKTAVYYEKEVAYLVARLGSVIEPALLLLVGIFIGLIVYSVLAPMYQVFQTI